MAPVTIVADLPSLDFETTYLDSELWMRLEPLLRQERRERAGQILSGRVKDVEDYRQALGFYLGLTWIFETADELTKQER